LATKAERKRIKELEREQARKERALAETAALLVPGKKAAAIWGGEISPASQDQTDRGRGSKAPNEDA